MSTPSSSPGRLLLRKALGNEARTNYALRETVLAEQRKIPAARPPSLLRRQSGHGLLVRQAGARQPRRMISAKARSRRQGGVGGARSAPRRQGHAYRRARHPARQEPEAAQRVRQHLVDRGLLSEGMQPAELGWGTHETWRRANAGFHERAAARRSTQPARRQHPRALLDADRARAVRLPRHPQRGDLDRRLLHRARREGRGGLPADLPLRLSSLRRRGALACTNCLAGRPDPERASILGEAEILDGIDELGVLLYGHARNAYWYGSQLSVEETRALAPYQNATGMQVTSAVLAGMVWASRTRRPASSRPTKWTFAAASKCSSPISAR